MKKVVAGGGRVYEERNLEIIIPNVGEWSYRVVKNKLRKELSIEVSNVYCLVFMYY
jgi:hypothetical protein